MSDAVLDSSAVLAFILDEPRGDKVANQINGALISSVNLAEVVGHLAKFGKSEAQIRDYLRDLPLVVVAFDETGAFETGLLRPLGKRPAFPSGTAPAFRWRVRAVFLPLRQIAPGLRLGPPTGST